ncbi:MAG TPA: LysR family transcriptional regulator [Pseudomonas sp.]|nr:LysR family transcriptional regulator [Pseudomonas sp.]
MVEMTDLQLFVCAITLGSLSAAGREMGLSPAAASKRLSRLEAQLGVRLLQRSSRQLVLTAEGTVYLQYATTILADVTEAAAAISNSSAAAQGTLVVAAPNALGRRWIAPLLASFAAQHPALTVRLMLSDHVVSLLDEGVDLAIRIGAQQDSQLISRKLATNRRIVCAAPAYLARHGTPGSAADFARHECLLLRRPGVDARLWNVELQGRVQTLQVNGRLSADNGDVIHDWALAGHGLALRTIWDVADALAGAELIHVCDAAAQPEADLHLVYPSRHFVPARVRLFIDLLIAHFAEQSSRVLTLRD